MPIKKRAAKARAWRVTPAAVDAFLAGDRAALHKALALPPWQPSPLEADTSEPPRWAANTAWADL